MRTLGVITGARSDYGIYVPLLRAILADSNLRLRLYVTGMHLSPEFGLTVRMIEADGFRIDERVEMLVSSDTPEGISKSMGLGVMGFAQVFARACPDILVVLGDRFEMYAPAVAALPFRVPVAHIHGGEGTEGAIDDALRHSMTKLSHLHFVALEAYARRVMQLGEEPWRITVCGALSLDSLSSMQLFSPAELGSQYGICLDPPPLLVTFHPVTLEHERTEWQITELLAALEETGLPVVFTLPNADTGNHTIRERIAAFTHASSNAWSLDNLGSRGYFSLMRAAAAMVGNSSSGIIEAPSLGLPVVNIGTRQTGRVRAANVIDTGYSRAEIEESIRRALAPDFRAGLSGLQNPYGDGKAAERILERLKSTPLGPSLLVKRFYDSPGQRPSADE